MKGKDLIDGLGFVDERFVHEAEHKKPDSVKTFSFKKVGVFAACFAILLLGSVWAVRTPSIPPDDPVSSGNGANYESASQESGSPQSKTPEPTLNFNHADNRAQRRIWIKGHFWQELSEKELRDVFHELADRYRITATANFSKIDENTQLYDLDATFASADNITASVQVSQKEIAKCYILDGEPILSEVNGIAVEAGYFDKTNNGSVIYYADFQIEDVYYSVEMTGGDAEKSAFALLLDAIVRAGKADLSAITPVPPKELRDEKLSLEEARAEETFGSFIPSAFPSGFSLNEAQRFVNQAHNYLLVSLSDGLNDIRFNVSYLTESDKARITRVSDTENYNLALYPIPRGDSVPDALCEMVDNPIFHIEELTLDVLKMRVDLFKDQGDSNGERMRFSILYGDVLVEVNTKGISADVLYAMLTSLQ